MKSISKIHHITAIVGDPNENLRYYRDVLGLRLVKQTVNFDDPGVYHLYFADDDATPGTVITFFPWTVENYGRKGSGQVGRIAFRVPQGSLERWEKHLSEHNVPMTTTELFGASTLEFEDPHGIELALVEGGEPSSDDKILGFHGVVLLSGNPGGTVELLKVHMGLGEVSTSPDGMHLETAGEEKHQIIIDVPPVPQGRFGIGTVHHIAWSVPDLSAIESWQAYLRYLEFRVTEVRDRSYFKSIYFGEKGNIIFEFASDEPGFEIDESKENLGTGLQLPPQYEHLRKEYEDQLPELEL